LKNWIVFVGHVNLTLKRRGSLRGGSKRSKSYQTKEIILEIKFEMPLIRINQLPLTVTRVSDMFCNFYLVKNPKIGKNSTTTKVREKISRY
jgi:hypothetical protein